MDEYGTLVRYAMSDVDSSKDKTGDRKKQKEATETLQEIYVPDWYEWQRNSVIEEIDQNQYLLDMKVKVEALPNAKNFIDCGEGHLYHNKEGFVLTFTDYETKEEATLKVGSATLCSIHTEYDYRGKGQCVTLSTPDNTYFIYPLEEGFNATKIQFAVEYLYE